MQKANWLFLRKRIFDLLTTDSRFYRALNFEQNPPTPAE